MKGHLTEEAYEGSFYTLGKTVITRSADVGSQHRGGVPVKRKHPSPCVSTLYFPSNINAETPAFQQANGFSSLAAPSLHYKILVN